MERDGGVDRDGRRPDAALRAVEGEDATQRWPSQSLLGREPGEKALDAGQQLSRVERLDEVVVGAGTQAADLLLHLLLGGQHDDRHVARVAFLGPDLRGDLVAVELRQHDVEKDQIRRLRAPEPESLGTIRRHDHVVTLLLERVLQESLDVRVVVDDEDLGCHQSSTRVIGSGTCAGSRESDWDRPGAAIIGVAPASKSNTSRLQVSIRSLTVRTSAGSAKPPVSLSVSRMATGRPSASATYTAPTWTAPTSVVSSLSRATSRNVGTKSATSSSCHSRSRPPSRPPSPGFRCPPTPIE